MSTQPLIELNNGIQIPQLGFGTFRVSVEETQKVTEEALAVGYRHIDTAAGYYNEAGVCAALKASGLPRESVFVTTKLRNGDQGYDSALKAFEDSRAALGVDVVDLYLVHWPVPSRGLAAETWKAFEKLYAEDTDNVMPWIKAYADNFTETKTDFFEMRNASYKKTNVDNGFDDL